MAMSPVATSQASTPKIRELEQALNKIGTTTAHKQIVFLILIGCLFDSFEQNTIGITGPMLREQWGLTGGDIGLLNTVTFGAAAVGRLLSGVIADNYGRRVMLGINLLLFTIGSLICAASPSFGFLCAGRAVVGFGLGGEISTAVTLLAEVSSAKFRGTAVGLVNVGAGGLGNFLAPAFGLLIFSLFPGASGWRWLFLSLALPSLLIVFYRRYIPETPRYLLSKNRIAEANKVLSILASGKLNAKDLAVVPYLSDGGEPFKTGNAAWSDIFKPPYASRTVPVTIAILMSYGAQLSVLTLLPMMLVAQGYTLSSSLLFTMVIQTGSFFGTVAASAFGFMFPRKLVLTTGAICACVAALCFGFLAANIYLLLFFGALFQFFVLVLNTTIWIYAPELYPTRSRAFGVAFILASGTAAGAIVPLISGLVLDRHGLVGVFAMIAVMYGVFAACIQFGPETFGKSMEDLNVVALPEAA